MIEIDIKLVPHGNRDLTRRIGKIGITNDASGDLKTGNYKYFIKDAEAKVSGSLKGFDRLDKSVFYLLRDVLNKALTD